MYIGTFYGMHFNVYWTIYVFRIFEPYHCWVVSPTAKGWARCWWQSLHVLLAKFSRDDWNMWALGKPLENEIFDGIPSGKHTKSYWKWPFIVDFPIKIVIFHSYGTVYQRVREKLKNHENPKVALLYPSFRYSMLQHITRDDSKRWRPRKNLVAQSWNSQSESGTLHQLHCLSPHWDFPAMFHDTRG